MKKILLLLPLLSLLIANVNAQTLLTNDFRTAIEINPARECNDTEYLYNNTIETPNTNHIQADRLVINEGSSYFSFIVPQTGDATIIIKLDNNDNFGLALYKKQSPTEYSFFKHEIFENRDEGQISISLSQELVGNQIMCRFWKLNSSDQGKISICIKSEISTIRPPDNNPNNIKIDMSYTATKLVEKLITGCLKTSNIKYTGDKRAIGYFTNGTLGVDISEGVILSTGKAVDAVGPNDKRYTSTFLGKTGNTILSNITNEKTYDAAVLEFDFVPSSNRIEFQFVFASEEYPDYISGNDKYNDIFAFLISGGPENYNNHNIALIPGTTTAISALNINHITNSQYYVSNPENYPNLQYNGRTVLLTAKCDVTSCKDYHIKLMVSDVKDGKLDSAVFLKTGSFSSGEGYTSEVHNAWPNANVGVYRGCSNYLRFSREGVNTDYDTEVEVNYTVGGTAIPGLDYTSLPESIVIPIDTDYIDVPFEALIREDQENTEVVIALSFTSGCPCDLETSELKITILPALDPTPSFTNTGPICKGETATINLGLEFPNADNVSATWESGETNINTLTVSPTVTTTYEVHLSYPCGTKTISTTVEVVEMPIVNLGPDISISSSFTTSLTTTLAPGNTGLWTESTNNPAVIIQSPTNPTTVITVPQAGQYKFTWTETSLAPNCVASDDIFVTFSPQPIPEFTTTTPSCFQDNITVTFTGTTSSENPIFNWNFDNANIISGTGAGPYEIHFPTPGSHTITLSITEYGITSSNDITVIVPSQIEGELLATNIKCFNSCTGYAKLKTSGGTPPYTYSWASGNFELKDLCKGEYSVEVTDFKGCSFSKNFEIIEPEELAMTHQVTNLNCYEDNSGQIAVNITGGVPPYNYAWSDGGANSATRTNLSAANYTLVVTDKNDCSITQKFSLTQPNAIEVSTNGDFKVCNEETINIIATSNGGTEPLKYYWSTDNAESFTLGTATLSINPTESVNYTVYVQDNNNCISNYAFSKVLVSSKMDVNIKIDNITCYGECNGKASLEISGGIQPFDFSWDSNTPILTDMCAGDYQVIITDNLNCSETISFTIEEPDAKISAEVITTDVKCSDSEDGTAKVFASGGSPPYQYQWSTSSANQEITAAAGTYYVTVSDVNNCKITIKSEISAPEPLEILPLTNKTICIDGQATVTAQAFGGTAPYSFKWIGENGEIHLTNELTASPPTTNSYELVVTDKNNCTNNEGKVQIRVNPPISLSSIHSDNMQVCKGDQVTLNATVSGGDGGPYQITNSEGEIIKLPYTYYPEENSTFTIIAKDNCETPAAKESISINVLPNPGSDFSADILEACIDTEITFTPMETDNSTSYYWEFGTYGFSYNPIITHKYVKEGIYTVSLTTTNINGCNNKTTKQNYIKIHNNPEAIFIANPEFAGINNPVIDFTNHSVGAIYNFWDFGDDAYATNIKNPRHIYKEIGEYEVSLICENSFGCRDTTMRIIDIRDQLTLYAATAFTPNGDGLNDCFRICANGVDETTFNLRVYNRWGEVVFFTDKFFSNADCSSCGVGAWDGTKKSKSNSDKFLPSGLYYWHAAFKDFNGVHHEYNGTVNLIR